MMIFNDRTAAGKPTSVASRAPSPGVPWPLHERVVDASEQDVTAYVRRLAERARVEHAAWQQNFDAWAAAYPERKTSLFRMPTEV